MQPTYPYLPGTVENDWRNVIYGSTGGNKPSDSIGIDANYFCDLDTSQVWGPKTDSMWPVPPFSLFHGVNAIFGATNGAPPSNTIGLDGDMFVDYQTSTVFGPKAGGVWPTTPASQLIGPANTIFGNSNGATPSNSIGLDGFYFFDTSTSSWWGPKASGAWPLSGQWVAGGVNIIFGNYGGTHPPNSVGIVGSYAYDTQGQLYYGPKTSTGWPTTGSYLSPVNTANTDSGQVGGAKPSNSVGVDGDYFVDADTCQIWGPRAGGAWPNTPVYVPPVPGSGPSGPTSTSDGNTITGQGAPNNSIGQDGDYYFDTVAAQMYGPKAAGQWPPPPPIWTAYHPNKNVSQTFWPVYTIIRGLIYSTVDINIWDKLTVTTSFGAASDLGVVATVPEAALGGNTVTTVVFDSNKTFLGPWGAMNTTNIAMAAGQQWQVIGSDFLAGINPTSGMGLIATSSAGAVATVPSAASPWGLIPKRSGAFRASASGYPVGCMVNTHLGSNWVYMVGGAGDGSGSRDNSAYIASGQYDTGGMVGVTLMRLT